MTAEYDDDDDVEDDDDHDDYDDDKEEVKEVNGRGAFHKPAFVATPLQLGL